MFDFFSVCISENDYNINNDLTKEYLMREYYFRNYNVTLWTTKATTNKKIALVTYLIFHNNKKT